MIKAIIFDCFGVVFSDNFVEVYKNLGGDYEADKEYLEHLIHEVSAGRKSSVSQEIMKKINVTYDQWQEENRKDRDFNWELLKYAQELRKEYIVTMLSNIGPSGLSHHMDYAVLEKHFDDIVESAKIGFAKPEARAYETAASRIGVRLDECVFIDDRETYCSGARSVGMKAVRYESVQQLKKDLSEILKTAS